MLKDSSIRVKLCKLRRQLIENNLDVYDIPVRLSKKIEEVAEFKDNIIWISDKHLDMSNHRLTTWIKVNIFGIERTRWTNSLIKVNPEAEYYADKKHKELGTLDEALLILGNNIKLKNGSYYMRYSDKYNRSVWKPVTVFQILEQSRKM